MVKDAIINPSDEVTMRCNVYIWYEKYRPFYVGIGNDSRTKCSKRNKWATNRRKQAELTGMFKQEIVLSGSRKNCEEVEKLLIFTYGSVSEGGLLFNFTLGGDGGDTFTFQTDEKKKEILSKRKENTDPSASSQGGKIGGARAAVTNKEKGNGPWNSEWLKKGTEASLKSRESSPDLWSDIGKKGALSSWTGEKGVKHREINAAACSKTGQKNKGRFWITNELNNSFWRPEMGITPSGWERGRTLGAPYVRLPTS